MSPVNMTIGTTYSVASGNAVPLLDLSAIISSYTGFSIAGGFPLAGTTVSLVGNFLVVTGTPGGGPGPVTGTITVNYGGGSQSFSVTINALSSNPGAVPTITIYPITIPLGVVSSKKLMDLGYATGPFSFTLVSGTPPSPSASIQAPGDNGAYLVCNPPVAGIFTGTISVSYNGPGSPQLKNFNITVA